MPGQALEVVREINPDVAARPEWAEGSLDLADGQARSIRQVSRRRRADLQQLEEEALLVARLPLEALEQRARCYLLLGGFWRVIFPSSRVNAMHP